MPSDASMIAQELVVPGEAIDSSNVKMIRTTRNGTEIVVPERLAAMKAPIIRLIVVFGLSIA